MYVSTMFFGAAEMAFQALREAARLFAVKLSAQFKGAFLQFGSFEGNPFGQRAEIAGGIGPVFLAQ